MVLNQNFGEAILYRGPNQLCDFGRFPANVLSQLVFCELELHLEPTKYD